MIDIKKIATDLALHGKLGENSFYFDVIAMPGEIEVLRITVENREELPIFLSACDEQILCISHLFHEDEVNGVEKEKMNQAMLEMNITMPQSSFAKINDEYVLYGSLPVHSTLHDIIHEIKILSVNTLEAIKAMEDYLK